MLREFCHCLGLAETVTKLTHPIFDASNDRYPIEFLAKVKIRTLRGLPPPDMRDPFYEEATDTALVAAAGRNADRKSTTAA
jgi:hypothetical protein